MTTFFERMQRKQEGGKPLPVPLVPHCWWCGSCWVGTPGDEVKRAGWIAVTIGGVPGHVCGPNCLRSHNTVCPRYGEPAAVRVEPEHVAPEPLVGTARHGIEEHACEFWCSGSGCKSHIERWQRRPLSGGEWSPTTVEIEATIVRVDEWRRGTDGRWYCGKDCVTRAGKEVAARAAGPRPLGAPQADMAKQRAAIAAGRPDVEPGVQALPDQSYQARKTALETPFMASREVGPQGRPAKLPKGAR